MNVMCNCCLACTGMLKADVEQSLRDVTLFLAALGNPHRDGLIVTCLVAHPDGLDCVVTAEAFKVVDDHYIMEFARMRGDSLLFAHVLRGYRDFVLTRKLPILFPGQLIPRCRLRPSSDPPLDMPPLTL